MDEPRWLADEMLGRLARYLRFLGYDTDYVRGVGDDVIVLRARAERRRVLTRDRGLAVRLPDSILLTRTDIGGQMKELECAFPSLRQEVRFERCAICNGRLAQRSAIPPTADHVTLPAEVRAGRTALYACSSCGHLYWEGSHTRSVRSRLARWHRSDSMAT
ncbi:MAG: Mut7-C RNAse domain-containing protein [Thermoplasmata archaeon]|nr:Mut7-C RNAse domain-containing protein [Thermoplasmata archaeon]